ncbi:MAG: sodium-dependent transporter [Lachnospiraceae bacterium]|nr:sodium-dependent transporter [Lachnospiraceae bacterium]
MKEKKSGFSSPVAMAIAMIAASVGTGNIWRFPRVAATNGGGAFVIAYIIIMILAVDCLMMAEHCIGRTTRKGLPGAMRDFIGNRKGTWFGSFVWWIVVITIAYYTVVVAWIIYYLFNSITGGYMGVDKAALFSSISEKNIYMVVIYLIIQGFCAWGAYKGVSFIEKICKVLVPVLFICIIIIAIRTVTLPGATSGLEFLFGFQLKDFLNYKIWLEALTQCMWSAGPGWGICIAYGVYADRKAEVVLTTRIQSFGDMSAALLAGIGIIPALFAFMSKEEAINMCSTGNNGLAFIALTGVFEKMAGGRIFAALFFLALLAASVSSVIAMYAIVYQPFADAKWGKGKAAILMFALTSIIGIPSCWNQTFFNNQDFVVGMGMVIGALFSCVAVYKFGAERLRTKFVNHKNSHMNIGKHFNIALLILVPVLSIAMFVWWCILSIGWNPDWYNPFGTYSLGTLILQLGGIGIIFAIFNKQIAKSCGDKVFDGEHFPEVHEDNVVEQEG